jgi:HEAT repeat protein
VSKQAFDQKLAALDALRDASAPELLLPLRKALKDRNNYFVGKVAAIVAEKHATDLIPDVLAAFDRFLLDPAKTDPQCWAKTALAKALKDLGHRGPAIYLRGIEHIQMEPVWGGQADSAGTLRGTCALALVECSLGELEILRYLGDRLADTEKTVRVDAALAIAQLGQPAGALLLRLKALLGDDEPEVLGQCFASLLSLLPEEAVPFIAGFLRVKSEEVRGEAVAALAQSREPAALEQLIALWRERLTQDMRAAVLLSLAGSPLPPAAEFLLDILNQESGDVAKTAITALARSRFHAEFHERVRAATVGKQDPQLERHFAQEFAL